MPTPPLIQDRVSAANPRSVENHAQQVTKHIDEPRDRVTVAAGAEGADTADVRRITLQARNRNKFPRTERLLVSVWFSSATTGAPVSTQTVTLVTGTLKRALTANQEFEFITDAEGKVVLDVEVTGAGTRYVNAVVLGRLDQSAALAWAA